MPPVPPKVFKVRSIVRSNPTLSASSFNLLYFRDTHTRIHTKKVRWESVALRYFQECCRDKQVGEIGRGDLLKFLTFLREEKRLSNRTAWTKLNETG